MTTHYRGFDIQVLEGEEEIEVKIKRVDGTLLPHEDNPSYYDKDAKEDAINDAKAIIDDWYND